MFSYILYIFLMLCSFCFGYLAHKKNKVIYLIILALLLSLCAGLRSYNVGIDTEMYLNNFNLIKSGHIIYAYGLEEGFKLFVGFLLKIWNSNNFVLFVLALLTNLFVLLRIWDFKDKVDIGFACWLYYISFFFVSMNISRQLCAVAIIFYFSRLVNKKKYVEFSLLVCLTSYFLHTSALIGFLYILLEFVQWRYLSKGSKMQLLFGCLIIPFAYSFIFERTIRYFSYFKISRNSVGFLIPLKLILAIVCLLLINDFKIPLRVQKNLTKEEFISIYEKSCINVYYIAGLLLTSIGYFYSYMDRIGFYFLIFEILFWSRFIYHNKNKGIIKLVVSLLFVYLFISSLLFDGQGVIPYSFFW